MRRSMADAILTAFDAFAIPNLPEGLPGNHPVQLLVRFRLDDLQSLKESIEEMDRLMPHATRA